jgi:phosphohistidine phosphatase
MLREIWILRHATAEDARAPGEDAARRLTRAGEAEALAVGRAVAARGLGAARVVTSPLVRARLTARLAASAGLASPAVEVEEDRRLAPGGDPEQLARDCLEEGRLPALLVGHNPDLEELVQALCGASIKLRKGAFVRISFEGRKGALVEHREPGK